MTSNQTTTLNEPNDELAYLGQLEQIVRRMAANRKNLSLPQAEDFVQYFLFWAWRRPDLRDQYVPQALASAAFNQRLIDFLRREGRQLPQGEYDPKTGKVRNSIWSLDHVLFEDEDSVLTFGDTLEGTDDWQERVSSNEVIADALRVLTPQQRDIYLLVVGLEYKVTEVAKMLGYKREWTQRELGKAKKTLSELFRNAN
ncbi:MAG: sigma-70 family RNA polymerase sigma factor [Actinobacteria bacterium]|nr:sigma-70 family RNA polymerase sigma factor [Actinomycetota bacterium]